MYSRQPARASHVEVFSPHGHNPFGTWRVWVNPRSSVERIVYPGTGSVVICKGAREKALLFPHPTEDDKDLSLGLLQPFLVIQMRLSPDASDCNISVHGQDDNSMKWRIDLSTSWRILRSTQLHTEVPLSLLPRGRWVNLVLDLPDLVAGVSRSPFHHVDQITISPSCKIRKIFTVADPPPDTSGDPEEYHWEAPYARTAELPRSLQFGPQARSLVQILSRSKLAAVVAAEHCTPVHRSSSSGSRGFGAPSVSASHGAASPPPPPQSSQTAPLLPPPPPPPMVHPPPAQAPHHALPHHPPPPAELATLYRRAGSRRAILSPANGSVTTATMHSLPAVSSPTQQQQQQQLQEESDDGHARRARQMRPPKSASQGVERATLAQRAHQHSPASRPRVGTAAPRMIRVTQSVPDHMQLAVSDVATGLPPTPTHGGARAMDRSRTMPLSPSIGLSRVGPTLPLPSPASQQQQLLQQQQQQQPIPRAPGSVPVMLPPSPVSPAPRHLYQSPSPANRPKLPTPPGGVGRLLGRGAVGSPPPSLPNDGLVIEEAWPVARLPVVPRGPLQPLTSPLSRSEVYDRTQLPPAPPAVTGPLRRTPTGSGAGRGAPTVAAAGSGATSGSQSQPESLSGSETMSASTRASNGRNGRDQHPQSQLLLPPGAGGAGNAVFSVTPPSRRDSVDLMSAASTAGSDSPPMTPLTSGRGKPPAPYGPGSSQAASARGPSSRAHKGQPGRSSGGRGQQSPPVSGLRHTGSPDDNLDNFDLADDRPLTTESGASGPDAASRAAAGGGGGGGVGGANGTGSPPQRSRRHFRRRRPQTASATSSDGAESGPDGVWSYDRSPHGNAQSSRRSRRSRRGERGTGSPRGSGSDSRGGGSVDSASGRRGASARGGAGGGGGGGGANGHRRSERRPARGRHQYPTDETDVYHEAGAEDGDPVVQGPQERRSPPAEEQQVVGRPSAGLAVPPNAVPGAAVPAQSPTASSTGGAPGSRSGMAAASRNHKDSLADADQVMVRTDDDPYSSDEGPEPEFHLHSGMVRLACAKEQMAPAPAPVQSPPPALPPTPPSPPVQLVYQQQYLTDYPAAGFPQSLSFGKPPAVLPPSPQDDQDDQDGAEDPLVATALRYQNGGGGRSPSPNSNLNGRPAPNGVGMVQPPTPVSVPRQPIFFETPPTTADERAFLGSVSVGFAPWSQQPSGAAVAASVSPNAQPPHYFPPRPDGRMVRSRGTEARAVPL